MIKIFLLIELKRSYEVLSNTAFPEKQIDQNQKILIKTTLNRIYFMPLVLAKVTLNPEQFRLTEGSSSAPPSFEANIDTTKNRYTSLLKDPTSGRTSRLIFYPTSDQREEFQTNRLIHVEFKETVDRDSIVQEGFAWIRPMHYGEVG